MQTHLSPEFQGTAEGAEAEAILRKCVHCGFCTATCPTYQILGDELDGPRGRIYLIKQVLEGVEPTRRTQLHLDRCLTCRNCETTCPSGVEYGALVDIGRNIVDKKVQRPWPQRFTRALLRHTLNSPLFGPAMKLGRALRPVLPEVLKTKVPPARAVGVLPTDGARHARQVLMLAGCVQPAMMPSIDAATIRVLDALNIGTRFVTGAGCCGWTWTAGGAARSAPSVSQKFADTIAVGTVDVPLRSASPIVTMALSNVVTLTPAAPPALAATFTQVPASVAAPSPARSSAAR